MSEHHGCQLQGRVCQLFTIPAGNKKGTAKKKILVLMSDTGGGHRASAEAIKSAFQILYGNQYHVSSIAVCQSCKDVLQYSAIASLKHTLTSHICILTVGYCGSLESAYSMAIESDTKDIQFFGQKRVPLACRLLHQPATFYACALPQGDSCHSSTLHCSCP